MRKQFFSLLGVAALCLLLGQTAMAKKPAKLRVMTFNIRLDLESDGDNRWSNRETDVCNMLRYYAPDLLGMQEVVPRQLADLKRELTDYAVVGVGRDDGKAAGEHCPIFFRASRFELLAHGDFALNESPEVFGLKGWDASYNRMATWVVVRDRQSGRKLAYVNTHLDNDGATARREGIRLVVAMMARKAPGVPLVVTGDFNCAPSDGLFDILHNEGMESVHVLARVKYGPEWTFHDFGRLPIAHRDMLDYVVVGKTFRVDRYRVVADKPDHHYLSDHCPVMVDLTVR